MRPTLVFVRHTDLGDRMFHHGDELPPDVLPSRVVDQFLDSGRLREVAERRSLFRLFHVFSGCKEREPLDEHELAAYGLRTD
jgi:hypothetical protein